MTTHTYTISQIHTQTHTQPETITLQLISRDGVGVPNSAIMSICGPTHTLTTPTGAYALSGRVQRGRRRQVNAHTSRGEKQGGGWAMTREDVSATELRPGDIVYLTAHEGDGV